VANTVVLTIYMKQKNNSLIHHMVIYVKMSLSKHSQVTRSHVAHFALVSTLPTW